MKIPRTFCITLRRTTDRWQREKAHLSSIGIEAEPFYGLDGALAGLHTYHTYDIDNPGTNYHIGPKLIALYLSHYLLWTAMQYMPEDEWWVLEDDAQFDPGWRERYERALKSFPAEWSLIWLGSCCTGDKPRGDLGNGLFEVRYPLCTHAYAVHRRALPTLLESHQKIWAPLDLALMFDSMPKLKVYTILPRLAGQFETSISP